MKSKEAVKAIFQDISALIAKSPINKEFLVFLNICTKMQLYIRIYIKGAF